MAQSSESAQDKATAVPVQQLTLWRHPVLTLYHFGCSLADGIADTLQFAATHPSTLYLALPALFFYAFSRLTGYAAGTADILEVRGVALAR